MLGHGPAASFGLVVRQPGTKYWENSGPRNFPESLYNVADWACFAQPPCVRCRGQVAVVQVALTPPVGVAGDIAGSTT